MSVDQSEVSSDGRVATVALDRSGSDVSRSGLFCQRTGGGVTALLTFDLDVASSEVSQIVWTLLRWLHLAQVRRVESRFITLTLV